MQELTLAAVIESIERVTGFVDTILDEHGCPMATKIQINIAIDELLGNIAKYAYAPQTGSVTVRVDVLQEPARAVITFIDGGASYNPLEQPAPDIAKPVEEREIGGLGIFVVKKTMDDISYRHESGKNMLTITKRFSKA